MTQIKQKDVSNAVVSTIHDSSYSDPTGPSTDFYNGGSEDLDGTTADETKCNVDFAKWHKYYQDVPIFAAIIDTLATWAVGKGFEASEETIKKLKKIKGWGKDDFNTVMENATRVCLLSGDSMGEIVRDKAIRLTNLKPLNVGNMCTVVNIFGVIDHYEQWKNSAKVGEDFKPKEIFHLTWQRMGDEIHGKPYAQRVESLIKQIKQLTDDLGLRFHRIVKPLRLFEATTNDPTKLAETEANLKAGYENCEFIVIPRGTLEAKDVATIPNADDAIKYLNVLMRELITACGVPEIILGWSENATDASSKIVYLAFQQRIERIQKYLEDQIEMQLGIELNYEFPASLEPDAVQINEPVNNPPSDDRKKEGKINNIMKK